MHLWWFGRAREASHDARCQDLPQLDTPLVEGIDLPDRPLREDTVLVQRDERAQRVGVSRSARIVFVGRLPSNVR